MAVQLSKVSYVIMWSRDPEMSAATFYRDLLGMTVKVSSPDWVELDGGGMTLALHKHNDLPNPREKTLPEVVFGVQDIHAAYRELKARGVPFKGEPMVVHEDPGGQALAADFLDPDGNRLSVYGYIPKR